MENTYNSGYETSKLTDNLYGDSEVNPILKKTLMYNEYINATALESKNLGSIIPRMNASIESDNNYFDEDDYEIAKIKANSQFGVVLPSNKMNMNAKYKFKKRQITQKTSPVSGLIIK